MVGEPSSVKPTEAARRRDRSSPWLPILDGPARLDPGNRESLLSGGGGRYVDNRMSCVDTLPTVGSQRTTATEPSFNEGLSLAVDRALRHLDLPPGLPEQIKACDSVLQVHFPVRLDDGVFHVFRGWRATHSSHLLPAIAGEPSTRAIGSGRDATLLSGAQTWPIPASQAISKTQTLDSRGSWPSYYHQSTLRSSTLRHGTAVPPSTTDQPT